MPTYEFRCPDGSIIERIFKISDVPSEIPAPDGSGMAVRIISGGAGLIFKGSGFYITDYGKDGKKDQRAASQSSEGGSGSESSKGESKSTPKEGGNAAASGGAGGSGSSSSAGGSGSAGGGGTSGSSSAGGGTGSASSTSGSGASPKKSSSGE